ncbi:MAG: hypothetical protein R2941_19125 [Desulfobacterales bacterium]
MSVAENEIRLSGSGWKMNFLILGSDIQAKYEAETDAIHANFQENCESGKRCSVEQKADALHADLRFQAGYGRMRCSASPSQI